MKELGRFGRRRGASLPRMTWPIAVSYTHLDVYKRQLYVIRNARLDPYWAQVERSTMSIAGRSVASLIHSQGIGDLYRIYATAQRDGVDFNLGFIPSSFKACLLYTSSRNQ